MWPSVPADHCPVHQTATPNHPFTPDFALVANHKHNGVD